MLLEDGGLHMCCGGRIKIWWFLLIVICWNLAMASSCRNHHTALWVRQTLTRRSFSVKMYKAVSDTWFILRTVWYGGILLLACYPQKCRQWWIFCWFWVPILTYVFVCLNMYPRWWETWNAPSAWYWWPCTMRSNKLVGWVVLFCYARTRPEMPLYLKLCLFLIMMLMAFVCGSTDWELLAWMRRVKAIEIFWDLSWV